MSVFQQDCGRDVL